MEYNDLRIVQAHGQPPGGNEHLRARPMPAPATGPHIHIGRPSHRLRLR